MAGYDKDAAKVEALRQESEERDVRGAADIKEFIALLRQPRAVMMLVPAGAPVDSVINDLLPHLEPGDLIIDGGNSYFKDTDCAPATWRRKASISSAWECPAAKKARVTAEHHARRAEGGYERVRPVL